MEAAGALGRSGASAYLEAVGEAARARSRGFWIVAGITVLAAGLRFATLGVQAYHHDEIVTVSRVLPGSFWHAMDAVGFSESAPPLYYALAWLWTQVTGTAEVGLRSLSALAGVATVPVAYLIGAELRDRRAGIAAAALVAVNPMLVWYSQEARGYALLALLASLSLLYFLRALSGRRPGARDATLWGVFSGLALATHYFAVFPIAVEAVWLLHRRGREAVRGVAVVAAFGLLLAPLAIHQMSYGHAEWIADFGLGHRLWEVGVTFGAGEVGDIIAQPDRPLLALAPLAAICAALALLLLRGERGERRAAGRVLAIAVATVAIPVAAGLLVPGKDFVLARNLLPALVPLLAAVAVAVTLSRPGQGAPPAEAGRGAALGRRRGAAPLALGAALVAYWLGFSVCAGLVPSLQRPDWEAVAERLGEPSSPRAMVTWTIGQAPLRYYLSTGSFQARASDRFSWFVHEVDFVSDGAAPPVPGRLLGGGFRQVGHERVGRFRIRRYALPGPDVARLRLGDLRRAETNFRSNQVLLDGIGPQ